MQAASYGAIAHLARTILDPVVDRFGPIELTYGFCSAALGRHIARGVAPRLDQHAGHETRRSGRLICSRLGQAADFKARAAASDVVASWITANLPFDRLYFYGPGRALHVSSSPHPIRLLVAMRTNPATSQLTPRIIREKSSWSAIRDAICSVLTWPAGPEDKGRHEEPRAMTSSAVAADILTIPEVASHLRVTAKTVYGLVRRGELPAFRVGRVLRCRRADVDDFIERSRKKNDEEPS